MASPQTENGYTKIANELLEAIIKSAFTGVESRVILWVARNSYGWSARKTKPMGLRKMAKEINANHSTVHLAIKVLLDHHVLTRDEKGRFSLNKDYETWLNGQPTNHQSGQPTNQSGQPTNQSGQPTNQSGQPTNHFVDEPKESKEMKESVKGVSHQNGHTYVPTFEEITDYAAEIRKDLDVRRFMDHYEANGWMRGHAKIADWKAVVRLWDSPETPSKEKIDNRNRCRCCRTGYFKEVKSRDGKAMICKNCREREDIEAGEI